LVNLPVNADPATNAAKTHDHAAEFLARVFELI
jgi:hypothetical protein